MCLLVVAEEAMPDFDILRLGEEQNPHGGGVAWRDPENKVIKWVKGITADDMMDMIDYKEITLPALFHFRIGTAGGAGPELTHPFPVTKEASLSLIGESKAVIAHNGHWMGWQKVLLNHLSSKNTLPKGPMSDTRAMAFLASIHGPQIFDLIKEKVAYLSNKELIIFVPEEWYEHKQKDGSMIMLSNNPYWFQSYYAQAAAQAAMTDSSESKYEKFLKKTIHNEDGTSYSMMYKNGQESITRTNDTVTISKEDGGTIVIHHD